MKCSRHASSNKLIRLLTLAAAISAAPVHAQTAPQVTLGVPSVVPIPQCSVYYYANDSTFPYLPSANGSTNVTFWVDGADFQSTGATLDTMGAAVSCSLSSGTPFDSSGQWLLTAFRLSNGTLVGFYHAEQDTFAGGGNGNWNSSGVATSTNDGATWTSQGEIVGVPQPYAAEFGGYGVDTVYYDSVNARWIGIGEGYAFASYSPTAAPGTWYGYYNGAFTTPMPYSNDSPPLTRLPGTNPNTSTESVSWNTYLNEYVMVSQVWGSSNVFMSVSADGLNWGSQSLILSYPSGWSSYYPELIGTSNTQTGQDGLLVTEENATQPGRSRDMDERRIHLGPSTIPATITGLTATPASGYVSDITLKWTGVAQAQTYNVARATASAGPFSLLATVQSSASFPTYTDFALTGGKKYYYSVTASSSAGTGGAATASATANTATAATAWYTPSAFTNSADGSSVTDWTDASGHGKDALAPGVAPTVTKAGINGLPTVHFNASVLSYLSAPRTVQDNFTIMGVFRSTQGVGTGTSYWQGAGITSAEYQGSSSKFATSLNANGQFLAGTGSPDQTAVSGTGLNDGSAHIFVMRRTESTGVVDLFIDGSYVSTVAGTTASLSASSKLTFGVQAPLYTGSYLTGDISEIKICAATLSNAEIQNQQNVLAAKYLTFASLGQTPTPLVTPAGGTFSSAQSVAITDTDPNAVLFYTTNGSTPTGQSTPYSGPFTVSTTTSIRAIAYRAGYTPSAEMDSAITISH